MIYECGHCGFIGGRYGMATNKGVTAPQCRKCGKLTKFVSEVVSEVPEDVAELPKDHWLMQDGENIPPMPLRIGTKSPKHRHGKTRVEWIEIIRKAGKYAVRCATDNGKDTGFSPDALIQNLIVGMLGYFTPDGTSLTSDLVDDDSDLVGDDAEK